MRLFRGRPCAVCAALFVCAAAAAKYLRTAAFYAVCAFLLAAAAALFVILVSRGKVSRERLISAAAVIALVFAFLIRCFALYIGVYGPLEDYAAGTHSLEGRVVSPGYLTPYSSSFTADITAVDGVECRVTADVSLPYAATGLSAGQTFSLSDATVSRTDVSSDRFAEGIMLDVTSGSEFGFVPGRTDKTLMYRASALNSRLSGMIAESVGGREGGLCAAMLLGSREYLDKIITRDVFVLNAANFISPSSTPQISLVCSGLTKSAVRLSWSGGDIPEKGWRVYHSLSGKEDEPWDTVGEVRKDNPNIIDTCAEEGRINYYYVEGLSQKADGTTETSEIVAFYPLECPRMEINGYKVMNRSDAATIMWNGNMFERAYLSISATRQ